MNAKQRALAWAIDRNDPDNWLTIPEFYVNPKDVDFKGFARPILGPEPEGREMKAAIRELVKVVRTEARKRFNSEDELLTLYFTAWKRASDEHHAAGIKGHLPPVEERHWSDDEVFGLRYFWIIQELKGCIRHYSRGQLSHSLDLLAEAASTAAALLVKMPIHADIAKAVRAQQAAKAVKVKLAKDPRQEAKRLVKECWQEWRAHPTRYRTKAAFAKDMLDKFDRLVSQPVITGWCRQWEKEGSSETGQPTGLLNSQRVRC